MKKLTCHCGAVKAEIKIENIEKIMRCNCSICKRKGAIMSMVQNEDFKITKGEIIISEDNISVLRTDTGEEYTLEYFLGNETLVVRKPNSEQAWLFTKVGN